MVGHQSSREDYRLFWPDRSEFVRMASAFNATIVPFAAVGCADSFKMLLDSEVRKGAQGLRSRDEMRGDQKLQGLRAD